MAQKRKRMQPREEAEAILRAAAQIVAGGCRLEEAAEQLDIEPATLKRHVSDCDEQWRQCLNHYLTDAKQFCRWLVKNRRMPFNPLKHLGKRNVDEDRRRERRDLTADEVARLLEAAARSQEIF